MTAYLGIKRDLVSPVVLLLSVLISACSGSSSGSSTTVEPLFQCLIDNNSGTFSISGSVAVEFAGILDSDTRPEIKPLIDNGSFASAQLIPNPVIVGGYLDRDLASPDTNDFYAIELAANDRVRVRVGDVGYPRYADLDLFLYDSNQVLVAFSENGASSPDFGVLELLTAPADGLYYIEVRVWEGGAGYVMHIEPPSSAEVTTTNALDMQFVPGEVVVQHFPAEEGVFVAQSAAVQSMESVAGVADRGMLMRMVPQAMASAVTEISAEQMLFRDAEQRLKYQTLRRIKQLRADTTIKHISPNYIFVATDIPDDQYFPDQWHYQRSYDVPGVPGIPGAINLPDAWALTKGDPDVVVAVIDSGILIDHPDFKDKLVDGYDFVDLDPDPTDPGGFNAVYHGTHVAGTIAAATDNGIGVAGVAWNTSIMPLRALGQTSGTFFDIMEAMRYAAGLENISGELPASGPAEIINLSLGGFLSAPDAFLQSVVDDVRAQGVIVVAAAGNRASSLAFYPASFRGVISVSAVGPDAGIASYSNFGPHIDIAAPGGADNDPVWSTSGPFGSKQFSYSGLKGTSMASPHVAGVIALMQSARVEKLTPEQVDFLLAKGALTRDLGSIGRDDLYGYGLIDAAKAVKAAIDNVDPVPTPILSVIPAAIDFQSELLAAPLAVRNAGGGSISVSVSKISAANWLLISEPVDDEGNPVENGEGVYTLRVSRKDLDVGTYTAEILIEPDVLNPPDVQQFIIPVSLTVLESPAPGEIIELSVALVNPAFPYIFMQDVPPQTVTTLQPDFQFDNMPAGCYLVVASSDIDGDEAPGDVGEKWGAWVAPDENTDASVVFLDADAVNVDFTASFD
jgi:serine protease